MPEKGISWEGKKTREEKKIEKGGEEKGRLLSPFGQGP